MSEPSPLPSRFAERPFATSAAIEAGVARQRLRRSDLVAPFHGVRAPASTELDQATRCDAYAQLMPERLAFAGPTAARIWGLPLPLAIERDPRLHVVATDGGRAPRGAGIVGTRTRRKVETRIENGWRIVAPIEAWIGLASMLSVDQLVAAGDRLLGLPEPYATRAAIGGALERDHGRRGVVRLRHALDSMRENVYSARETRTRLVLVRAGVGSAEPEPNGTILLHHGGRTRGDLVFRQERVVVEYEGEHHLTDPVQWAKDLVRYNDLALSGWLVIRLSKHMSDGEIIARVAAALRTRA